MIRIHLKPINKLILTNKMKMMSKKVKSNNKSYRQKIKKSKVDLHLFDYLNYI